MLYVCVTFIFGELQVFCMLSAHNTVKTYSVAFCNSYLVAVCVHLTEQP